MRLMISVMALMSISAYPAHGQQRKTPRFNVILVSIDTLAAKHMSAYGYSIETTPFFTKLARESVFFENAYSVASWTLPSHYSIFTGLYPETHKIIALEGAGAPKL